MRDVERFDPDADECGEGLFGRVLAAAPRSGRADADLIRLLDRHAQAMLELAVRRAGARGSPNTGTDDLIWAACRDERGGRRRHRRGSQRREAGQRRQDRATRQA